MISFTGGRLHCDAWLRRTFMRHKANISTTAFIRLSHRTWLGYLVILNKPHSIILIYERNGAEHSATTVAKRKTSAQSSRYIALCGVINLLRIHPSSTLAIWSLEHPKRVWSHIFQGFHCPSRDALAKFKTSETNPNVTRSSSASQLWTDSLSCTSVDFYFRHNVVFGTRMRTPNFPNQILDLDEKRLKFYY